MAEYNESQINSNETERIAAEQERINNEAQRQTKETEREAREATRQSNESTRISEYNTFIADVHNAEDERIANEEGRVQAEASRVTAEQGRVKAENIRAEFYEGFNSELEGLHAKDEELSEQLTDNENRFNSTSINVKYPPAGLDPLLCDGTDESLKLQAIIDYASKKITSIGDELTGFKIIFPSGHYRLQNINLPDNCGISLCGDGGTKSTIELIDKTSDGVLFNFTNNNNYRGEITGLRITGGINGGNGKLISITDAGNQIHIHNNWIDSCRYGIYLQPCADMKIYNNTFEFVNTPIYAKNSYDLNIYANMFYGYGPKSSIPNSFYFNECKRFIFNNNLIVFDSELSGGDIINISNSDDFIISNNIYIDNETTDRCIRLDYCDNFTVNNNILSSSISENILVKYGTNFNVTNNKLKSSQINNSIWLDYCEKFEIQGNISKDETKKDRILISSSNNGNVYSNILSKDIYIEANSSRVFVEGTVIYNHGCPPIYGEWVKGDILYSTNISGGYIGYVCIEGDGTGVGTWKGFGAIQE